MGAELPGDEGLALNALLAPFWNLDQVFGWAETRDPEILRAAALSRYNTPKDTVSIAMRSTQAATTSMYDGRDIGGELWAASGWKPKISRAILSRRKSRRFARASWWSVGIRTSDLRSAGTRALDR